MKIVLLYTHFYPSLPERIYTGFFSEEKVKVWYGMIKFRSFFHTSLLSNQINRDILIGKKKKSVI